MPFRLDRAFIHVGGPDAVDFLDNLVTQDLSKLAGAGVLYSALLTPQGKVVADMFVWRDQDGVLLELDPSRTGDILRRFAMYKLRANVTIGDASARKAAYWNARAFEGASIDPRSALLGWRSVSAADNDESRSNSPLDAHRIEAGAPDLVRDAAPEEVFALEALLEELDGVDFQKGCFVGQENVSRMKRRATTRKKFCPVVFDGDAPPYGTPVRAGDTELGSIRSGMAGRAIALVRLDRALEATGTGQVLTAGDTVLQLAPPPWLILPDRG